MTSVAVLVMRLVVVQMMDPFPEGFMGILVVSIFISVSETDGVLTGSMVELDTLITLVSITIVPLVVSVELSIWLSTSDVYTSLRTVV